jgi:hypothetical protein
MSTNPQSRSESEEDCVRSCTVNTQTGSAPKEVENRKERISYLKRNRKIVFPTASIAARAIHPDKGTPEEALRATA